MLEVESCKLLRPYPGENVSGDCAVISEVDGGLLVSIIDVLGHGWEAYKLARTIEQDLSTVVSQKPLDVMTRLNERLQGSIGAAAGIGFVDLNKKQINYIGVGNTVIRKFGSEQLRLISRDGVLGRITQYPMLGTMKIKPGEIVLLYTDGVRDHFVLAEYPQLLSDTPRTITRSVIEKFGKAHDDATCIALKFL